jgi:hypothetical protein
MRLLPEIRILLRHFGFVTTVENHIVFIFTVCKAFFVLFSNFFSFIFTIGDAAMEKFGIKN